VTEKLLRSIHRADCWTIPRFATNPARLQHHAELDAIIGAFCGAMTQAECCAHFDRAGVTIGPIMDAEALEADPYVAGRAALIEVPDAEMPGGRLPDVRRGAALSRTRQHPRPPARGLASTTPPCSRPCLGAAEVTRLRAAGILHG
jgi:crotonobetainyl-CoA:carnitine CoA-transferase CaiB-like acyl-CoA transferase